MNHPYQVMGTSVPQMLGRRRLIERLDRHVMKPSPDHVQVVGPTLFGKSVLLNALAGRHVAGNAQYVTAAYVDLRHAPPTDDAAFRRRLAESVKTALSRVMPETAGCLDLNDPGLHELLVLVLQEMEQNSAKLLLVLDGFDHVLAGIGISRNFWDNLLSLAGKSSLTLVTGSRCPLRELCKTEESRTSDFWEIFYDTPLVVGPFIEGDWEDLLDPLTNGGAALDGSARKELVNWSGGVPVLAAALLNRLADTAAIGQPLTKEHVDKVAGEMLDRPPAPLEQLWDDCGVELRGDIALLAAKESEGLPLSELPTQRQRALEGRGYGQPSGSRMRSSCRLMARYASQQAPAVADLRRLFGTAAGFNSNVRGLLELRLAQLDTGRTDPQLRNYAMHAIRDMDDGPETVLVPVRSIVQRALTVIWDAEVGPTRNFPQDWVQEWQHGGAQPKWLANGPRVPGGDGQQLYALRLMTGTKFGDKPPIRRTARFVTKPTFLLLDHLQSVGDFGQHRGDYPESNTSVGFAASVVLAAIGLIESLSRDLAAS